ncbi:hypothetical protein ALC60_03009 [Trachymyrmex zeteki]|uniref:Uncharacterized protein n=1 Tax=Mycetomoellerius zeteki TaxID=64791 RepID=A0A151XCC2_9HYME|nr:hypothetical protein ALC60_03009 [Trachymyrmex zeteki]
MMMMIIIIIPCPPRIPSDPSCLGALNTKGGGGGGDRRRQPHGRTNRTDMSVAAQLPHPRSAVVSRFRLVSSLRSSTRLLVYDVQSSSMLILPSSLSLFLLSFLPFFLLSFSVAQRIGAEPRASNVVSPPVKQCESRRKRACDTGGRERERDEERKSQYHHLAYAPLSTRLDDEERERDSERRETEGRRRKSVETIPAVIRARPSSLRHFRYHHHHHHHHHHLLLLLLLFLFFSRDA